MASTHTGTTALNANAGADTVDVQTTVGATTVDTGIGTDTVTVRSTGATMAVNTGADSDTINVRTIGAALTVKAGSEDDTVNVGSNAPGTGSNVNAIGALLTVDGEGGTDTLNVDDSGDAAANTGMLTGTTLTGLGMAGGIGYAAFEALNIGLGSGGDTFTMASTHTGTTALNANAGADTVDVQTTAGATTVDTGAGSDTINVRTIVAALTVKAGSEDDTVNVGSNAPGTGGNVNAIGALLTVDGEGGTDTLNVDDSGDAAANTGVLTGTTLTGLGMAGAGLTYGTMETLNIGLGSGGDTFTIASTHAGSTTLNTNGGADTANVLTTAGVTTVNTGSEDDTVNVGSNAPGTGGNVNSIGALLTVNGEGGSDTLNVDDSGDIAANPGNLTSTRLTGLGLSAAGLTYGTMESLNIGLGSGSDTFTVASTHAGSTTLNTNGGADTIDVLTTAGVTTIDTGADSDTINVRTIGAALTVKAGSGDDTVNVGSNAPGAGGNVDSIGALLTVSGEGGTDALNVDDTGDALANTGVLTGTMLTGLGMAGGIGYAAFEALNVGLGSGGDTFTIASTQAGVTSLNANSGNDTVNVRATTGATNINGGDGDDTINVGSLAPVMTGGVAGFIQGKLTLAGNAGSDALHIDDSGDVLPTSLILDESSIAGLGMGPGGIAYDTIEAIDFGLGSGGNSINIRGIGVPVAFKTGSGDDTVNVGSLAPVMVGGTLNRMHARLTLDGQAGNDTLYADDSGDTADNTGLLTAIDADRPRHDGPVLRRQRYRATPVSKASTSRSAAATTPSRSPARRAAPTSAPRRWSPPAPATTSSR